MRKPSQERRMRQPRLSSELPETLKNQLPSIEALEMELKEVGYGE